MPRRRTVNSWKPAQVKLLHRLAGRKSASAIARTVRRSEAAVRFKAWSEGLSLAMK